MVKMFVFSPACIDVLENIIDLPNNVLMFQASKGFQRQCLKVLILDNDVGNEPNKQFSVIISNPAIMTGPNNESIVTIIDDDGSMHSDDISCIGVN